MIRKDEETALDVESRRRREHDLWYPGELSNFYVFGVYLGNWEAKWAIYISNDVVHGFFIRMYCNTCAENTFTLFVFPLLCGRLKLYLHWFLLYMAVVWALLDIVCFRYSGLLHSTMVTLWSKKGINKR